MLHPTLHAFALGSFAEQGVIFVWIGAKTAALETPYYQDCLVTYNKDKKLNSQNFAQVFVSVMDYFSSGMCKD